MKRIGIALVTVLLTLSLSACGEKRCNKAGAVKAEKGILYYCSDRNDGNGLRWYKS